MYLTHEQEAAVKDQSALVAVSACPGSGKTRVVVAKVEDLVRQGIEPWVLTFTAKAAREISLRIEEQCGVTLAKCGTFHSVFFDHRCDIASELETKDKHEYWKQEDGERKVITYDMILDQAIERGIEDPPSHVIVDECQDNDPKQWAIIKMLMDAGSTIMLVGDLDQSIYGWRDAAPEVASEFFSLAHDEYGSLHILSKNFRSHPDITTFSTNVLHGLETVDSEVIVCETFSDFIRGGAMADAILCRTNRDVHLATRILQDSGVDVSVAVDRKSLQKFQAWMGLLASPYSTSKLVAATGMKGSVLSDVRVDSMRRETTLLESYRRVTLDEQFMAVEKITQQLTTSEVEYIYLSFCGDSVPAARQLSLQFGSHSPREAAVESCVSMITPVAESGIRVMTMHTAKGLEFDRVAIAAGTRPQLLYGELGRLVYVALTRAKSQVRILSSDFFSPVGLHPSGPYYRLMEHSEHQG